MKVFASTGPRRNSVRGSQSCYANAPIRAYIPASYITRARDSTRRSLASAQGGLRESGEPRMRRDRSIYVPDVQYRRMQSQPSVLAGSRNNKNESQHVSGSETATIHTIWSGRLCAGRQPAGASSCSPFFAAGTARATMSPFALS
jgi:hypothetical protein